MYEVYLEEKDFKGGYSDKLGQFNKLEDAYLYANGVKRFSTFNYNENKDMLVIYDEECELVDII